MKRRKLNKWEFAERAIVVTTVIMGAYFFVALIIAVVNFIKIIH